MSLLAISGIRIHYRILGSSVPGTPPLIILHGGPGGNHDIMVPGVEGLAGSRQVVLYDQRGCGKSTRLTRDISCTLADNVADLDALREHLDLDRIDLMGHSWGGLLALLYALEHGDRIRKMVLAAPAVTYYPNASWSEFLATLPPNVVEEIEGIRADKKRSPTAKQAAVWRITLREFFYRKSVLKRIDLERMAFTPEVGNRLAAELDGLDLRPRLPEIRIPTLIAAGRRDPRLPVEYHEELSKRLPDARLVVFEESGHFPFLEETGRFTDVVSRFLEKI